MATVYAIRRGTGALTGPVLHPPRESAVKVRINQVWSCPGL